MHHSKIEHAILGSGMRAFFRKNPVLAKRFSIALASLGLFCCYAPVLFGLCRHWAGDEDMGHGFLVPFAVLWILWRERGHLLAVQRRPSWWGLGLLIAAACMECAATLSAGLFVGSVAFLLSLTGAVILLFGFPMLRAAAFPFLLTLFMLPKLAIVYSRVTLPLQLLASRIAAASLAVMGETVARQGNILTVHHHSINVAEACSGIRYLLPIAFLALLFGYLAGARPWMRVGLLGAAIPLAILANGFRVALVAANPMLDSGAWHVLVGCVIFLLCLAVLAGFHGLLHSLQRRHYA